MRYYAQKTARQLVKLAAMVLTVALFLVVLAVSAAAQEADVSMVVTSNNVWIRTGPGTEFPRVYPNLQSGQTVVVTDRQNGRCQHARGWSACAYLSTTTASSGGGAVNAADVLATTSWPIAPASIKTVAVPVVVRGQTPYWLFTNPTGVATGQNYPSVLPAGWTVVVAAASVAVHREGGVQQNFESCPLIRLDAPPAGWQGGFGVYEGMIYVAPTEWATQLIPRILEIQRIQCGQPNLQVTVVDTAK